MKNELLNWFHNGYINIFMFNNLNDLHGSCSGQSTIWSPHIGHVETYARLIVPWAKYSLNVIILA